MAERKANETEALETLETIRKRILRHGYLEDIFLYEDASFSEGFLVGFGKGYKQGEKAGLVGAQHPHKHKCSCGSWKTYFTQYGWMCKRCFEAEYKNSRLRRKREDGR